MKKPTTFDEYIATSNDFAQPILTHIRTAVSAAHPDIEEVFKWSIPNFIYNGKIVCFMASFKAHATFGFWLAEQMTDEDQIFKPTTTKGMGQFGKLTHVEELPSKDIIVKYVLQAVSLIDEGTSASTKKQNKHPLKEVPEILNEAFQHNPKAKTVFENMSISHKNEYIEWIIEAKRDTTKEKRVNQTIEWLTEGKSRNWKYK